MKFHLTQSSSNQFTGYGPGYVQVNQERYETGLIVQADRVVSPWASGGFAALAANDFAQLLELKPAIVILGTGTTQRFPHPRLIAPLAAARIGLEVMDTPAACRTFNILVGEDRNVLAAILLEAGS